MAPPWSRFGKGCHFGGCFGSTFFLSVSRMTTLHGVYTCMDSNGALLFQIISRWKMAHPNKKVQVVLRMRYSGDGTTLIVLVLEHLSLAASMW